MCIVIYITMYENIYNNALFDTNILKDISTFEKIKINCTNIIV